MATPPPLDAYAVPFPVTGLDVYVASVSFVLDSYRATVAEVPIPNITAIASTNGQINITFDQPLKAVATPTSDPVPAVQIDSATKPSEGVLRINNTPAPVAPIPPFGFGFDLV